MNQFDLIFHPVCIFLKFVYATPFKIHAENIFNPILTIFEPIKSENDHILCIFVALIFGNF